MPAPNFEEIISRQKIIKNSTDFPELFGGWFWKLWDFWSKLAELYLWSYTHFLWNQYFGKPKTNKYFSEWANKVASLKSRLDASDTNSDRWWLNKLVVDGEYRSRPLLNGGKNKVFTVLNNNQKVPTVNMSFCSTHRYGDNRFRLSKGVLKQISRSMSFWIKLDSSVCEMMVPTRRILN